MKGKAEENHPQGVDAKRCRSPAVPAGVIYVGYSSLRASGDTFLRLFVNSFPAPIYRIFGWKVMLPSHCMLVYLRNSESPTGLQSNQLRRTRCFFFLFFSSFFLFGRAA